MGIGIGLVFYVATAVACVILLLSRVGVLPELGWEEAAALGTTIVGSATVFLAKVRPLIQAGKASPTAVAKALIETSESVKALRSGDMSLQDAEDELLASVQERREGPSAPAPPSPRTLDPTPELLARIATMSVLGRKNAEIARSLGVGSWEVELLTETPAYRHVLEAAGSHVAHRDD
tara:strand:- start:14170 stop:14703 length:534 start_codon:yes stop_codon:yes gene_type:complete